MSKKNASKETIDNLQKIMGKNFSSFVPLLCNNIHSLEQSNNDKNGANSELGKLLLKLNTFCLIINLDLSTSLRANFRSTSTPEKRCNLKNINVILIEGYNYLFGFKKQKKHTIWRALTNTATQINHEDLIIDIKEIEKLATDYKNIYAEQKDRDERNLSIHYDSDPNKVYNLLLNISEETEAKKASAFLGLLENINIFINKYIKKYQVSPIGGSNKLAIKTWERINHFDDINNKIFTELESAITRYSERLDRIILQSKAPKTLQTKLGFDNAFYERFIPILESINPSIHIFFIYIELASAVRAYLSSEFYFEKQLNLRRVHIIVYEGFKHIYGYNDSDNKKSFWERHISSILSDSTDIKQRNALDKIESALKQLALDNGINNVDLRECVVHYRYKERDNVLKLFNTLVKSNPLMEMNKALKLLKLLPQLIEINTVSTSFTHNLEQEKIKSTILAPFNEIIFMTDQIDMEAKKKQEIIDMVDKIKKKLSR